MNINMKTGTKTTTLLMALLFFLSTPVWANTFQIALEVSVPVEDTAGTGITKATNRIVLGVHPEATTNYDPQWDTPALFTTPDPENQPMLKAYIVHPEYASNQQKLWRDIQSDADGSQKTWNVAVVLAPSEIGKTVTLSWTLPPSLMTSQEKVTLLEPDSQSGTDMRKQSSYNFVSSSSSPKTLSVTISSPGGSSDNGGASGAFGCGRVKRIDSGKPNPGLPLSILINLLILLSPVLLWLRPFRVTSKT